MGHIRVTGLGKAYKQYPTRWSRLAEWLIPFSPMRHRQHWVLQDVNFEIAPGEAVGIVGVNGAGKSTLLKMITGTTQPTCGNIKIAGQVEALMPEIERFAEIGEAIDQPVRTYSSGMQMRLAFSVATGRRPDILIVDEALSVGDAYFQQKSFDRID